MAVFAVVYGRTANHAPDLWLLEYPRAVASIDMCVITEQLSLGKEIYKLLCICRIFDAHLTTYVCFTKRPLTPITSWLGKDHGCACSGPPTTSSFATLKVNVEHNSVNSIRQRKHHHTMQPVPPSTSHRPKSRQPLGEGVWEASGSVGETAGGSYNRVTGKRPLSRPAKTDLQWGRGVRVSNASAVLAAGHNNGTHWNRCNFFALWQLQQHVQL